MDLSGQEGNRGNLWVSTLVFFLQSLRDLKILNFKKEIIQYTM